MPIGALGEIPFVCSRDEVFTFSDLSRELSMRWASHEVIGRKPMLEWVGPASRTVSFKMRFDAALGVNPSECMERMRKTMHSKKAHKLIVGEEDLGTYVIEGISEERKYHSNLGACIVAEITVNLKEQGW